MWYWARRIFTFGLLGIGIGLVATIARTNPNPLTAPEISRLTVQLNEAAAIGVPHDFLMAEDVRAQNFELLTKVETGAVLGDVDSAAYRKVFQTTLAGSQTFLGAFDRELSILNNHAPNHSNNINGSGISGRHDHHDLSAAKNFGDLLNSLSNLQQSPTVLHETFYANRAQKDLVDLISHMGVAPHTVSVDYVVPVTPWSDPQLGDEFEAMVQNFKLAQFQNINSVTYWMAIDQALLHYDALILKVQDQVNSHTAPWQRRVAGRFNSLQTLAPPVSLNRPLRRK